MWKRRSKAKNLGMEGLSRKREAAPVSSSTVDRRLFHSGDGVGFLKRDGRGIKILPACGGVNHEEVKAQEGMVGSKDINRGLISRPIFTRTKTLKTEKACAGAS